MLTEHKIYAENEQIKKGLIAVGQSLAPTHAVHFIINKSLSLKAGQRRLNHFHRDLEQRFLGKYFYKKPSHKRILSISFPENPKSNLHYHSVFSVPTKHHKKFDVEATLAWLRVCKSGNLKIYRLDTPERRYTATNYCLKQICQLENYEGFVLSSQFWSSEIKCTRRDYHSNHGISKVI